VKGEKEGVWGNTGHFLVRIDTTPPALFKPEVEYVLAAAVLIERALVSFFTTDALSGIDHYEVGVIDKSQPVTESPSFVQSESPYQVPIGSDAGTKVIVRAVDKAGNVLDVSVDVLPPESFERFFRDNVVPILLILLTIALILMILHFFWGHHVVRRLRKAFRIMHDEEVHAHDHGEYQPLETYQSRTYEPPEYQPPQSYQPSVQTYQSVPQPPQIPIEKHTVQYADEAPQQIPQQMQQEGVQPVYQDHEHTYQEPPPRL
jgi:hypothetical protein